MLLRQVVAIAAFPAVMAVLIPASIVRRNALSLSWPTSVQDAAMMLGGVVVAAAGLVLFAACVVLFWTRGRGTLAPWDPPRRFVAAGPYRLTRNPMISGVALVLVGEALLFRSGALALWAGLFALINAIYIPLWEEPMLEARFGEPYKRYLRQVPRFVPFLRKQGRRADGAT